MNIHTGESPGDFWGGLTNANRVDPELKKEIYSFHSSGVMSANVDGSVHFISLKTGIVEIFSRIGINDSLSFSK